MLRKSNTGQWIRLKGISGHGKNRIREQGDIWLVVHVDGSKVMLRSRHKTFKAGGEMFHDGRWISTSTDKNFEIVEIDI